MAPHVDNHRGLRGTIISMILIMCGIVACVVSLIVGTDIACRADINHWSPVYPGAELIEQRYTFFRPRASGITNEVYRSADDRLVIQRWYREYRREITRGVVNERNPDSAARGIATTSYTVSDDPEGEGSLIRMFSECAYY